MDQVVVGDVNTDDDDAVGEAEEYVDDVEVAGAAESLVVRGGEV